MLRLGPHGRGFMGVVSFLPPGACKEELDGCLPGLFYRGLAVNLQDIKDPPGPESPILGRSRGLGVAWNLGLSPGHTPCTGASGGPSLNNPC